MAKEVFDAGGFLESQGLTLSRVGDKGEYFFNTPDGQEVNLDVQGYLKAQGVPVERFDVEFNTPDAPLDQSPVGMLDRAKMALGNTRGSINYLKGKFDDVRFSEETGITVKNKGVWQRVDQEGMDPWELSKDVVEGVVSLAPSMYGAAKGAVAGAATGATLAAPAAVVPGIGAAVTGVGAAVGGIVGAGIGGATGNAAARSVLGRVAGTYQPESVESEMRDIATDFVLNAGGQGLAVGAKLAAPILGKAIKNIAAKSAAGTKDVLIELLGRTTGAGTPAMQTVFNETDDVVRALNAAKAGKVSTPDVVAGLKQKSIEAVDQMVEAAPKALSRKFGEAKAALVESVDDTFTGDVGGIIRGAQEELAEMGLGVMREVAEKAPGRVLAIGEQVAAQAPKGKQVFQLMDDAAAANRMASGLPARVLDAETKQALQPILNVMKGFEKVGKVKGKNGAAVLMEFKKNLNAAVDSVLDRTNDRNVEYFVTQFKQAATKRIGETFEAAGAGEKYVATGGVYQKFADSVRAAQRVARSENGSEVLLNKLVQGAGANQVYKDFAGDMAELLGKDTYLRTVRLNHAAAAMAPVLPRMTLSNTAASTAVGGAAVATGALPPAALGLATQASPRLVLKEVQAARKGLEFFKSLPGSQKAELLQNPTMLREFLKFIGQSNSQEQQLTSDLLKQAGVQ